MAIKRINTPGGLRCRNTETNLFTKCSRGLSGVKGKKKGLGNIGQILEYRGARLEPYEQDGEMWVWIEVGSISRGIKGTLRKATKVVDDYLGGG